jgi:GTPase SAR1 family protein
MNSEYNLSNLTKIRNSDGFLVLYDTTNRKTFENIPDIVKNIHKIKDLREEIFPILLVGTKNDLIDLKQVSFQEETEMASNLNMNFVETSSKTSQNCEESFLSLLKEMELFNQNKNEKNQSKCNVN